MEFVRVSYASVLICLYGFRFQLQFRVSTIYNMKGKGKKVIVVVAARWWRWHREIVFRGRVCISKQRRLCERVIVGEAVR